MSRSVVESQYITRIYRSVVPICICKKHGKRWKEGERLEKDGGHACFGCIMAEHRMNKSLNEPNA